MNATPLGTSLTIRLRTGGCAALTVLVLTQLTDAQSGRSVETSFDVVTVKRYDGERFSERMSPRGIATLRPLAWLVSDAFGVSALKVVGLPDWASHEWYQVVGTTREPYSPSEIARMLRPVLEDRFGMTWHREVREAPVYALRRSRGDLGRSLVALDRDCSVAGACKFAFGMGHASGDASWSQIQSLIARSVERAVIDQTGLAGSYHFTLTWTPGTAPSDGNASQTSIFTAVREQLGLRLEPAREPMEVIVIDSIRRPTPD